MHAFTHGNEPQSQDSLKLEDAITEDDSASENISVYSQMSQEPIDNYESIELLTPPPIPAALLNPNPVSQESIAEALSHLEDHLSQIHTQNTIDGVDEVEEAIDLDDLFDSQPLTEEDRDEFDDEMRTHLKNHILKDLVNIQS